MNRRDFFRSALSLVGGIALEQAVPLGRVWSFPTEIARPQGLSPNPLLDTKLLSYEVLEILRNELNFIAALNREYDRQFARRIKIGDPITIRKPPRYPC